VPDIVLVQALCNFLFVGRRHDSPSYIWMLTGIAIRMAQALGLQRDGSHFDNLTPYQVEIRRRVWWMLCILDARSSEDQRADFTISLAPDSFDTKIPLNLNDSDIDPDATEPPVEREGITNMTFARISAELCEITRRIVALGKTEHDLEEQGKLLSEMHDSIQRSHLRHASEPGSIIYWAWVAIVRITVAKMKLITHLPTLFSPTSNDASEQHLRDSLLVAAIEVCEHNHALSTEPRFRQWLWVLQTYTHWHAIVFLLLEMTGSRPWSPMVERAWNALRSPWLIPTYQFKADKHLRAWVPLRKLMARAKAHREAELVRLRGDPTAACRVLEDDARLPAPLTAGRLSAEDTVYVYQDKWRKLVGLQDTPRRPAHRVQDQQIPQVVVSDATAMPPPRPPRPQSMNQSRSSQASHGATYSSSPVQPESTVTQPAPAPGFEPLADQAVMGFPGGLDVNMPAPADPGSVLGWLWADDQSAGVFGNVDLGAMDLSADFEGEVDWSRWVETAQGMDMDPAGWT
jgi:hypothetical protein